MLRWLKNHLRESLVLNTYLLVLMRILQTGFGFLFWIVAARTMPPDQVGLASGAVAASTLLAGMAHLGMTYGLLKYLPLSSDPDRLLNTSITISGLISAGAALVFLAGLGRWSTELLPLRSSLLDVVNFLLLVVASTLAILLHAAFLALRGLKYSLLRQVGQAALSLALLPILLQLLPGYSAAITANVVAWIASTYLSFSQFLPALRPAYRFRPSLRFLPKTPFGRYSTSNFIGDQIQRAPEVLLPLAVLQEFGRSTGAHFFVVWTIARGTASFATAVADSFFAEGAHRPGMEGVYVRRAARIGALLSAGLALATFAAGPYVLALYGRSYMEEGVALLNYTVLAGIPGVFLAIFVSFLRLQERLRAVFTVQALSHGLGGLFAVAMMQRSFTGIGIGWLAAQVLVLGGALTWWHLHGNSRTATVAGASQG